MRKSSLCDQSEFWDSKENYKYFYGIYTKYVYTVYKRESATENVLNAMKSRRGKSWELVGCQLILVQH